MNPDHNHSHSHKYRGSLTKYILDEAGRTLEILYESFTSDKPDVEVAKLQKKWDRIRVCDARTNKLVTEILKEDLPDEPSHSPIV